VLILQSIQVRAAQANQLQAIKLPYPCISYHFMFVDTVFLWWFVLLLLIRK